MNIKGRKLCDNCFLEIKGEPCKECGYKKTQYKPEIGVLPVGTVLKQKYHIGKVLGKGGFGITYKAYDAALDKVVAIKEYYPNGIAHRDTGTTQMSLTDSTKTEAFTTGAEKFFDEAKTVSRFNGNPNIVGVYEFFYENSTVYYVMEYLEGCDLKSYIRKNKGKIPQEQVLTILNVISDALFITHNLNVLHRDISPDNIYVQNSGEIKLIDFGAARQVIAEQSKSLSVILKQGFAPLEQYQRKGKQGPWTDIYALGATCMYALTGKIPDDATERIEDSNLGTAQEYGVDEDLWAILEKCLAVKTGDRYQDILELKANIKKLKITPVPLVMEKKNEIPMTVAVDNVPQSENQEIGKTVGVLDVSPMPLQDNIKEQKSVLQFFKSVKGIIVVASILILIVATVAVALAISGGKNKNTESSTDIVNATDSKKDDKPEIKPTNQPDEEPTKKPDEESTNGYGSGTITVWVPEELAEIIEEHSNTFLKNHKDFSGYSVEVQAVSTSDAALKVSSDVNGAADIYMFSSDEYDELKSYGLTEISTFGSSIVKDTGFTYDLIKEDGLYGVPIAVSSEMLLYYDKSVLEHCEYSLELMIEYCEKNDKNFYFPTSDVYSQVAFYFATGCEFDCKTNESGELVCNTNVASEKGLIALKEMISMANSEYCCGDYTNSYENIGFVITGRWNEKYIKEALGDNYEVFKLPKFKGSDGNDYQMFSFVNLWMLGVKPQTDENRELVCREIVKNLINEDVQTDIADLNSMLTPVNDYIPAIKDGDGEHYAIHFQGEHTVLQGKQPGAFWEGVGSRITDGTFNTKTSDEVLMNALQEWEDSYNASK